MLWCLDLFFLLILCVLIFVHVHFLPHCNKQALVQFLCPTQRKIFECRILVTRSWVAILFSSPWVDLLEGNGKSGGEKGKGWERDEGKSSQLCWILIHDFASIHGWCSRTFPWTPLFFSNFMKWWLSVHTHWKEKITSITYYNSGHQFSFNKHLKFDFTISFIPITSSSPQCKNEF